MIKNIFKLAAFGLLVFLATEISLRIIQPTALEFYFRQKQYHKFEPDYFVDLEANARVTIRHFMDFFTMRFSTNEYGFRGTDPINNQMPQIGCIGDSITMGFGVHDEDTFCYRLNHYQDSAGVKYQSVNLGVDAYGPTAIAEKLEKYAGKLNLKLLYYLPSPGDDIDDIQFQQKKADPLKYQMFKWQFLLTKHSYAILGLRVTQEQLTYRFKETFIWPYQKLRRTLACNGRPLNQCGDVYGNGQYHFLQQFISHRPTPLPILKTTTAGLPAVTCQKQRKKVKIAPAILTAIDKIRKISQKHKIRLVLIATPIDVETAYCSQRGLHHGYYDYILSLKDILVARGYEFMDMNEYTEQMKDANGKFNVRPYYIYGDGHYTKKGHDWIYKVIYQKTREILP